MNKIQLGKLFISIAIALGIMSELYSQTGGQNPAAGQAQPQAQAGQGNQATQPAQSNKTDSSVLTDYLINDFENAEDWRALSTNPIGETKIKKVIQIGSIEDAANPTDITADEKTRFVDGQNNVLGVKTYFMDRGFDRVEVKPPHEYIIPGIARQLSVWALGRQFRHTIFAKLRDYRGKIHTLKISRLDFFGWKKLTVTIPGWLPQSTRYALLDKNLHFVSLYTVCDKKEVPGVFYFYVDDLRMKIDKTDTEYPGSKIKDIW
ncbi:MAG: flagellar filament outer layer protein FlaA [Spirochaetia bacterium]|nr:flagellar filament outer layer protein FlaA [Spirochaetia bacterium]